MARTKLPEFTKEELARARLVISGELVLAEDDPFKIRVTERVHAELARSEEKMRLNGRFGAHIDTDPIPLYRKPT